MLENYSNTVLENSLTLAKNTDFLISSLNGFAAFTYFIGSSQGKIKKLLLILYVKKKSILFPEEFYKKVLMKAMLNGDGLKHLNIILKIQY